MEVVVGSKVQEVLCPIPRVGSGTLSTDRASVVLKLVPSSSVDRSSLVFGNNSNLMLDSYVCNDSRLYQDYKTTASFFIKEHR